MRDPYLDELRNDFDEYSNQLKKLKKKLLKTNSSVEQAKIIKQLDSIANKMENNQKQSVKVTKSRIKERKNTFFWSIHNCNNISKEVTHTQKKYKDFTNLPF